MMHHLIFKKKIRFQNIYAEYEIIMECLPQAVWVLFVRILNDFVQLNRMV